MKTAITFLVLCLTALGCATRPLPPALTQADVISMVKAGMSDEDIMRRVDASGTVFRLSSDDIVMLRREGVSDRLVTFMMDTYTRAALQYQERQDYYRYGFHHRYWWGHPHWWW